MAKFLMDFCFNNRTDICNDKVRYSRWPKRLNSSNDIPPFPVGKAQEELDVICEECPHAMFIIEECCPVCSECKMSLVEREKIMLNGRLGAIKLYHYVCDKCGKDLFSKNAPPC
jgi:hypothetical protein